MPSAAEKERRRKAKEELAALTKAYQAAARPVVKKPKKAPPKGPSPLPAPTATYVAPVPKLKGTTKPPPKIDVGPKQPGKGKAAPIQQYRPLWQIQLGVDLTADEKRAYRKYSREQERLRRAKVRTERRERREERKLREKYANQNFFESLLDEAGLVGGGLKETGKMAVPLGKAAYKGLAKYPADFSARLSAGLAGRESGREISASDDPFLNALGTGLIGENIIKAARGEEYDRNWLIAEMALLPIPLRGVPTSLSTVLRGVLGSRRFAKALREGMTVAEAVKELNTPLLSHTLSTAGRNVRVLREGDLSVEVPAAQGWIPRKLGDVIQSQRDRIPGMKSTKQKIVSELEKNDRAIRKALEEPGVSLNKVGKKLSPSEQYAIRLIGEGEDPREQIAYELLRAEGSEGAQKASHLLHAGLFSDAAKFVEKDPNGPGLVFSAEASPELREAWELGLESSGSREDLYERLGLLTREQMEGRVQAVGQKIEGTNWQKSTMGQLSKLRGTKARKKLESVANHYFGVDEAKVTLRGLNEELGAARGGNRVGDAMDIGKEVKRAKGDLADAERQVKDFLDMMDARALSRESARRETYQAEYDELKELVEGTATPTGHVRLYRGERPATVEGQGGRAGGEWYTTDREFASQYGPVRHVDIPKEEASKYLSSRLKHYGVDEFDPASGSEFILPEEWVQKSVKEAATPEQVQRFEAAGRLLDEIPDPELYYGRLHDVQVGIPEGALEKITKSQAQGAVSKGLPPAREIKAIAKKILAGGAKLPPEISSQAGLEKAIKKVYELALEGEYGRFWYDNAAGQVLFVAEVTGLEPKQVAQLFAIYSQAADTIANATFVFKAIDQWKGYTDIYAGRFPEKQSLEALAVMRGEPWEGRKRSSFYQNIAESMNRLAPGSVDDSDLNGKLVTVDRWVVRMFAPELKRDVPAQYYDVLEQLTQEMAAGIGWEPKELQAAAWVSAKAQGLGDAKRKTARHLAGAEDAFEYGVKKNFTGQGELFATHGTHPDTLRAVASIKSADGGFTLYPDLTDAKPTGFLAAYGAYEFKIDPKKVTPRELELYRDAHATALKDKRARVGGWHDPDDGIGYLDISREFKTRAAAMKFAREQGQIAITDASTFKSIPTGLTQEKADAIKLGLKGKTPVVLPGALLKKEAVPDLFAAHDTYDELLNKVAKKLGWPMSLKSRDLIEDIAFNAALKDPESDFSKKFLEVAKARYEGGDIDEAFGPARLGDDATQEADLGGAQGVDALGAGEAGDLGGRLGGSTGGPRRRVLGLYERSKGTRTTPRGGKVSLGEDPDQPVTVLRHELEHFHEDIHLDPVDRRLFEEATGASLATYKGRELFAEMSEDWLISIAEGRVPNVPEKLLPGLRRLGDKAFMEYTEHGRRRRPRNILPEEVQDLFDNMMFWQEIQGGGKLRIPYRRGLPVNVRRPWRQLRLYASAAAGSRFGGSRRSAIGRGATDPTVTHAFQGALKHLGTWKGDVTKLVAQDLFKAIQVGSAFRMREHFLKASTAIPKNVDDVPIKVDPTIDAPPELGGLLDMLGDFEMTGAKRDLRALEGIELDATTSLGNHLFPKAVDGQDPRLVAMQMIENGVQEPIENIRWIPSELFMASNLLNTPAAIAATRQGWGKAEKVGMAVDAYNDMQKALILILNLPPYITMNFGGNIFMNLFQQGPFALANLPRAAFLSQSLDSRTATWIDHVMGSGFAHQADLRTPVKFALNPLNNMISKLVDMVPRRSSFLYEAGKRGYKTPEALKALREGVKAGDADLTADYLYIWRRANNAIIDYEDLGPLEKKYVTRILFIYPWIKGATKYTARFPADHPWQAMAMAALYERQQAMADDELGDRPWYADLEIPLGTVERYGEEYPYTINPKQLLPMTTPYDYAKTLYGFATSDPRQQDLVETLNPFLANLNTALSGKRAFDDKDVGAGLATFLRESDPRNAPLVDRIKALLTSEEDREAAAGNKLYPRNLKDEVIKALFGSLAPKPYNPKKGQWMAKGERGREPRQEMKEKIQEYQDAFGSAPPQGVIDAYESKAEWRELLAEAHTKKSDLTDEEITTLKLGLLILRRPQFANVRGTALQAIESGQQSVIDSWVERELGWNDLESITRAKNEKKKAEEAGAVIGASR